MMSKSLRCRLGLHKFIVVREPTPTEIGEEADMWCERCHYRVTLLTFASSRLTRQWEKQGRHGPWFATQP